MYRAHGDIWLEKLKTGINKSRKFNQKNFNMLHFEYICNLNHHKVLSFLNKIKSKT